MAYIGDVTSSGDGPAFARLGGLPRDALMTVASALAATLVASFPLLFQPRFFYTDDYQTYFIPMFMEIARLVGDGELPFITDRLWRGGAILAEYQPAVLNPVSLGLYLLISRLDSAPAAAAVYSLFHIALFAGGTFFLCRALACKTPYAMMAAISAPACEWILYWGAIDWIPALVSIAWFPWALGALVRLYRDVRWFVPAVLTSTLVLVSGWPFALLASAVVTAVVAGTTLPWQLRGRMKQCLPIYVASLAAGLLAAPAVLPMFPYLAASERPLDIAPIWQANLAAVFAVGLPFHRTTWDTFFGSEVVPLPMTYVAWFVPFVIANGGVRRIGRTPLERVVALVIICFAVLSMLPTLGHFRWMFRLLPYYHLALLVLVAIILSRDDGQGLHWRFMPTALALVGPLLISVLFLPQRTVAYVASALLVLAILTASLALKRWRPSSWVIFALLSNIAVIWAVSYSFAGHDFPSYPKDFKSPFELRSSAPDERPLRRFAIYPSLQHGSPASFWSDFAPGNTGLLTNSISVNGYSPFDARSYRSLFCFDYLAAVTCDDIIDRLTTSVGATGRNLLDLMRIEELSIQSPPVAAAFRRAMTNDWQSATKPTGTTVFSRRFGEGDLPDPISWQGAGLSASVISQSPRRIDLHIENTGAATTMILARAWYPGWRAELDGATLPVGAMQGLLVEVKVPALARGDLVLTYTPAGLLPGLWLAGGGLCILVLMTLLQRASRRRALQHAAATEEGT